MLSLQLQNLRSRCFLLLWKLAVYNTFKDGIRKLADLKQQISEKMILFVHR